MEIHSVLPEERARDAAGEQLPWGYRYAETSRGVKQPDDSGAFGRHRSLRATGSRTPRSRAGTTPVRQKENPAVADFGRLFAKEQSQQEDLPIADSTTTRPAEPLPSPTECVLYGYASKSSEWKVLSKYEKIVSPSIICEDYPREDPNLFMSTNSPLGYSRSSIVVHKNLSQEAMRKSRIYKGGKHWIKVTFDSYPAAERACFYSPIEVDGYSVYCELWTGRGPTADVPILQGSQTASLVQPQNRTLPTSKSAQFLSAKESAIAGFERVMQTQTLPRSVTLPDVQYGQPETQDDISIDSTTASTATAIDHALALPTTPNAGLRSRSVPHLPSQSQALTTPTGDPRSSTAGTSLIPTARRAILRPISEALPKQPSLAERIIRTLPIVNWFISEKGAPGDFISDGPKVKDDGSWDEKGNSWYWGFWYGVDKWLGSDFCGLKEGDD